MQGKGNNNNNNGGGAGLTGLAVLGIGLAGAALGFVAKALFDDTEEETLKKQAQARAQAQTPQNIPAHLNTAQSHPREPNSGTSLPSDLADDEELLCPITSELMKVPVISKCGHTFERESILDWLKKNEKCPVCSTKISVQDLTINYSLKNVIDKIRKV